MAAGPEQAIQLNNRYVVGAVIIYRLNLCQHKAGVAHELYRFMELPLALVYVNDRQLNK